MATASLVLGIIAILISIFGFGVGSWVGCICGILAIIFGAVSKKKAEETNKGAATAGLVLGIIALCWGIIVTAACVACTALTVGLGDSLLENPDAIEEGIEEFFDNLENHLI